MGRPALEIDDRKQIKSRLPDFVLFRVHINQDISAVVLQKAAGREAKGHVKQLQQGYHCINGNGVVFMPDISVYDDLSMQASISPVTMRLAIIDDIAYDKGTGQWKRTGTTDQPMNTNV